MPIVHPYNAKYAAIQCQICCTICIVCIFGIVHCRLWHCLVARFTLSSRTIGIVCIFGIVWLYNWHCLHIWRAPGSSGYLLRVSGFSLVGNIVDHGRASNQTKPWNWGLSGKADHDLVMISPWLACWWVERKLGRCELRSDFDIKLFWKEKEVEIAKY